MVLGSIPPCTPLLDPIDMDISFLLWSAPTTLQEEKAFLLESGALSFLIDTQLPSECVWRSVPLTLERVFDVSSGLPFSAGWQAGGGFPACGPGPHLCACQCWLLGIPAGGSGPVSPCPQFLVHQSQAPGHPEGLLAC